MDTVYEFDGPSLFTQLDENVQELLQRVEPKADSVPAQTPVSPPASTSALDLAVASLPVPEIPAPLPTSLEGEDGLPQPPPPADEEEQQQSEQLQLQEQDKEPQLEQSDAAEKPPAEPVVDGIAGKHTVFLFLGMHNVYRTGKISAVTR